MGDRTRQPSRDSGFTLVESLLVTVTIAIITAAVATAITVTLRHTPPSEVRADDARSLQGLVTWLPQDIDAAPPNGFHRGPNFWPCAGPAPANSKNVVTAGFLSNVCVEATSRSAYDRGYRVCVAKDATAASSEENQQYVEREIYPILGEAKTCAEIVNELE